MTALWLLAGLGACMCLLFVGMVLFAVGCTIVTAWRERR